MDAQSIRAGRAYVELGTNDSKLVKGLFDASRRIEKYGAAIRGIGLELAGLGGAALTPLVASARQFASHSEQINKHAEVTGLSDDAVQSLGYAAQQTGVDSEALTGSIAKMSRTLVDAARGGREGTEALQTLGLTVSQLNGLTQEDRFKLFADAIERIDDPAARAAATMKIFGKSGAELLPLLDQGSAGISRMQARFQALGLQLSDADVQAGVKFQRTLNDLWDVLQHGVETIGAAVVPVLTKFANIVINAAMAATSWVKAHRQVFIIAAEVAAGFLAAGTALVIFGTALTVVGIALGTVASVMGIVVSLFTLMLNPIFLVGAGLAALAAYFVTTSKIGSDACNGIIDAFRSVWDAVKFVLDNSSSLNEAWANGTALAGLMIKSAWADAKSYLEGIWYGLKDTASKIWDDITTDISEATTLAVEGFTAAWAYAVREWKTLVNEASASIAVGVQYVTVMLKTGLKYGDGKRLTDTDADQIGADRAQTRINAYNKSLKDKGIDPNNAQSDSDRSDITSYERNKARQQYSGKVLTPDEVTALGNEELERQKAAIKNSLNNDQTDVDAELDAKLKKIKDLANARVSADEAARKQKKSGDDSAAADSNAKNVADAKKAADDVQAYKDQLAAKHNASGGASVTDKIKNAISDITNLKVPDFKVKAPGDTSDLLAGMNAGKDIKPLGAFNLNSRTLTREIFGSGSQTVQQQQLGVLKQIATNTEKTAQKVGPMRHS